MAKVYFRYGVMNSGKSIDLLKVAHNYEEQGKSVLIFSPAIDTRSAADKVASRIGIEHDAVPVYGDTDLLEEELRYVKDAGEEPSCVLIDEAQFLTQDQVMQLCIIADHRNVPVIAYGLRTDFQGNLFEGSRALMETAENIEEIKTVCSCGRKATYNGRFSNGILEYEGPTVKIGGNESYKPLCRKCYVRELAKAKKIRGGE